MPFHYEIICEVSLDLSPYCFSLPLTFTPYIICHCFRYTYSACSNFLLTYTLSLSLSLPSCPLSLLSIISLIDGTTLMMARYLIPYHYALIII